MEWLNWFEQHKELYARVRYKRAYTQLSHPQIQVLQDIMAGDWMDEWFAKNINRDGV